MSPPKIVLTNNLDYKSQRNFAGLPLRSYKVVLRPDFFKIASKIKWISQRSSQRFLKYTFWDWGLNRGSLVHLFGAICLDKRPWVTSFSGRIPDWGKYDEKRYRRGVRSLASSHCKKLIAISNYAACNQMYFLESLHSDLYEQVAQKLIVLHPAQQTMITAYEEKQLNPNVIVFTFVGKQFFRKGGKEVLFVFDELLSQGANIALNIVSVIKNEPGSRASDEDLERCMEIINRYPGSIRYQKKLPNEEVLALLKSSHVALLPTYFDLYGYSVLEAQACATPVISTDVQALSEINDHEQGWLIPVPKNNLGERNFEGAGGKDKFSTIIADGIRAAISEILSDPSIIRIKGIKSLQRIGEHHDPYQKATEIERIYDVALSRKE